MVFLSLSGRNTAETCLEIHVTGGGLHCSELVLLSLPCANEWASPQ